MFAPGKFAALGLILVLAGSCAKGGGEEGTTTPPADFCGSLSAWSQKCTAAKTPCDDALAKDCPGLVDLLNTNLVEAARTCVAAASCDRAPLGCLADALPSLAPSDAQKSLATKYCAECAKSPGAACEAAFFVANAQTILPFSDNIAEAVGEKCMTKIACVGAFPACASGVVSQKLSDRLPVATVKCLAEEVIDRPQPTDAGVDSAPGEDTSTSEDTGTVAEDTGTVTDTGVREDTMMSCGTDEAPETFTTVPLHKSINDCDGSGSSVSGTIQTTDDVDYFRFHGDDTAFCRQGGYASTSAAVRLCMLPKCNDGTYPSMTCTKGTKATVDGKPMCCVSSGGAVEIDFNCSGTDDSADVYLRVSSTTACRAYKVDYHY
jgi:hypothetical protein